MFAIFPLFFPQFNKVFNNFNNFFNNFQKFSTIKKKVFESFQQSFQQFFQKVFNNFFNFSFYLSIFLSRSNFNWKKFFALVLSKKFLYFLSSCRKFHRFQISNLRYTFRFSNLTFISNLRYSFCVFCGGANNDSFYYTIIL